jgi:hypothetical protein
MKNLNPSARVKNQIISKLENIELRLDRLVSKEASGPSEKFKKDLEHALSRNANPAHFLYSGATTREDLKYLLSHSEVLDYIEKNPDKFFGVLPGLSLKLGFASENPPTFGWFKLISGLPEFEAFVSRHQNKWDKAYIDSVVDFVIKNTDYRKSHNSPLSQGHAREMMSHGLSDMHEYLIKKQPKRFKKHKDKIEMELEYEGEDYLEYFDSSIS